MKIHTVFTRKMYSGKVNAFFPMLHPLLISASSPCKKLSSVVPYKLFRNIFVCLKCIFISIFFSFHRRDHFLPSVFPFYFTTCLVSVFTNIYGEPESDIKFWGYGSKKKHCLYLHGDYMLVGKAANR